MNVEALATERMTEEHGKENLWLWMKFSVLRTGTAVLLTLERSGRNLWNAVDFYSDPTFEILDLLDRCIKENRLN
jgi:hypothetical protein